MPKLLITTASDDQIYWGTEEKELGDEQSGLVDLLLKIPTAPCRTEGGELRIPAKIEIPVRVEYRHPKGAGDWTFVMDVPEGSELQQAED